MNLGQELKRLVSYLKAGNRVTTTLAPDKLHIFHRDSGQLVPIEIIHEAIRRELIMYEDDLDTNVRCLRVIIDVKPSDPKPTNELKMEATNAQSTD